MLKNLKIVALLSFVLFCFSPAFSQEDAPVTEEPVTTGVIPEANPEGITNCKITVGDLTNPLTNDVISALKSFFGIPEISLREGKNQSIFNDESNNDFKVTARSTQIRIDRKDSSSERSSLLNQSAPSNQNKIALQMQRVAPETNEVLNVYFGLKSTDNSLVKNALLGKLVAVNDDLFTSFLAQKPAVSNLARTLSQEDPGTGSENFVIKNLGSEEEAVKAAVRFTRIFSAKSKVDGKRTLFADGKSRIFLSGASFSSNLLPSDSDLLSQVSSSSKNLTIIPIPVPIRIDCDIKKCKLTEEETEQLEEGIAQCNTALEGGGCVDLDTLQCFPATAPECN